jgi:hypothetical protein
MQKKRKTVELTSAQDTFIKRKKRELQKLAPPGEEDSITESGVIQGLIDFWMALDAERKLPS